jgi:GNAT superfamily N-acetyltransferase
MRGTVMRGRIAAVKMSTALLIANSPHLETVLAWHWHEWSADHADADREVWREQLRGRTRSDGIPFTVVASFDDQPVGCLTVCDDDADERHADRGPWLTGMLVIGTARNLGVGRRLLADAAERARAFGARELWLHTGAAAQFYERCGYEIIHRKQSIDDDAVLWREL